MKTMDKILIIMAIAISLFTIVMVILFCIYQTIPDSLVTAFFGLFTGEMGFMGCIQIAKKIKEGKTDEADEETDI